MSSRLVADENGWALSPRQLAESSGQFVDGYHQALYVGAALLLAGAVVSVLTVGRGLRVETEPLVEAGVPSVPPLGKAA